MAEISAPPAPEDEKGRLRALRNYGVLDTERDEAFDRITRLASRLLDMPVSLVSLVDVDRQWFKSRVGLDAEETPRELAFCAHAICEDETLVVENALADPRFRDNPLVTNDPNIRFYAGAPLTSPDGHNLGTLCVIDREPRTLTDEQRQILEDLAMIVIDELEFMTVARREQQAQTRLIEAVESLSDGFVIYDENDRLVVCNEKYRQTYPESADLFVPGATFEHILRVGLQRGQYNIAPEQHEEWLHDRMEKHRNPGAPIEQQLADGRWLRIEERRTGTGALIGFRVDITATKERELELTWLASYDSLTGALNRRMFTELAEAEMKRSRRFGSSTAVLMIDIDHFKAINDHFGHAGGDAVLKELLRRFGGELRDHDLMGRLGGEEFAILLPQTSCDGAYLVAERLRVAAAKKSVDFEKSSIDIRVSIGATVCDPAHENLEAALSRADAALYQAKRGGRNRVIMIRSAGDELELTA